MNRLTVAPIVEGHGEQQSAIRTLLTRIWTELLEGEYIDVLQPIRIPRSKLVHLPELLRAVDLAALKIRGARAEEASLVLVLFDADRDAPCVLAPRLAAELNEKRGHLDTAVVLANVEYETWFVAAAESLSKYFDLDCGKPSGDPEQAKQGKGLVKRWMGNRYAETVDQPRITAAMDLALARRRSPSFDKLCRELERRRFG